MKLESIESTIEFLSKYGIVGINKQEESGKFNRCIEFEIEGNKYFLEWWVNQSYLKFKDKFSSPSLACKYINVNTFSPTTKHRFQLCFYDVFREGKDEFMYNEIPFWAFKIPFNN